MKKPVFGADKKVIVFVEGRRCVFKRGAKEDMMCAQ